MENLRSEIPTRQGGLGGHSKTVAAIPSGLQNMHVDYISHADTRVLWMNPTLGLVLGGLLVTTTADPMVGSLIVAGGGITVFGMFVEDDVELKLVSHESRPSTRAYTSQRNPC